MEESEVDYSTGYVISPDRHSLSLSLFILFHAILQKEAREILLLPLD